MALGKERSPVTPSFVRGVKGAIKKQQPNNHIPNQKKTKKVVM